MHESNNFSISKGLTQLKRFFQFQIQMFYLAFVRMQAGQFFKSRDSSQNSQLIIYFEKNHEQPQLQMTKLSLKLERITLDQQSTTVCGNLCKRLIKIIQNTQGSNFFNFPIKTSPLTQTSTKCSQSSLWKQNLSDDILESFYSNLKGYKLHKHVEFFVTITKFLSGEEIFVCRSQEMVELARVAVSLNIRMLSERIKQDLHCNKQEYGCFTILNLSNVLGMKDLERKVMRELIKFNFQQFNYELYDLLQCNQDYFQHFLKLHKEYVHVGICKGQSNKALKNIVGQYQDNNQVKIDANQFLILQLYSISEEDEEKDIAPEQQQKISEKKGLLFDKSKEAKVENN